MSNICSLQSAINQSNQGQASNQQQQLNQTSTGSLSSAALLGSGYGQAGGSLGQATTGYLTTAPYVSYPQWATQSTYGYTSVAPVDPNTFTVRKVENGYILNRAGKEYVVTDEKSVEKFLKLAGIAL